MSGYTDEISGEDIMSVGAQILWSLRRMNDGTKGEDGPMDDIIEQVQGLIEQTGYLGDRVNDYSSRICQMESQIIDAQQQNDTLLTEVRAARIERDELLGEVEKNWEDDVVSLREQAEAAAKEKKQLATQLAESKQDLEYLKSDKGKLEDVLLKCQLALEEREEMVANLREQLDESEEEEDSVNEEVCGPVDSGVDTSDLKRSPLNRSMEERFRSKELLQDLQILGRKCKQLEADNERLETRLNEKRSPDSSTENSPFRPGFMRSRSLHEELIDTSFFNSSGCSGGDADRTPAASSLNYHVDDSSYMECDSSIGHDLDSFREKHGGFAGEKYRNSEESGSITPPLKSGRSRKGRWLDFVLLIFLYLTVDVICFNVFGQHLFSFNRVDRRVHHHTAIF